MSAKERVLAVCPDATACHTSDNYWTILKTNTWPRESIYRDGVQYTEAEAWAAADKVLTASRLPSPQVEGATRTAVKLLARYLEAKSWSMWDQSDPELNRLREIEQKMYDEHRNHGFTGARIKAYEAVILAALRDDNKEAQGGKHPALG